MATLTVRNLPPEVHDSLRRRAAEKRRSVEAEVRAVIAEAVWPAASKPSATARLRGSLPKAPGGERAYLAERRVQGALEQQALTPDEAGSLLEALDAGEPADAVLQRLDALLA